MGVEKKNAKDVLFDVLTPLGFHVRVSRAYWQVIVSIKHPIMAGHEKEVKAALEHPERSGAVKQIHLFIYFILRNVRGDGFAL